jgi:hypothetical protein
VGKRETQFQAIQFKQEIENQYRNIQHKHDIKSLKIDAKILSKIDQKMTLKFTVINDQKWGLKKWLKNDPKRC